MEEEGVSFRTAGGRREAPGPGHHAELAAQTRHAKGAARDNPDGNAGKQHELQQKNEKQNKQQKGQP
jgi:hypothetical protein